MWFKKVISFFVSFLTVQPLAAIPIPAKEVYGPVFTPASEDVDILARTIWGEARSEGIKGMQAVANVIMNRYLLRRKGKGYPSFGRIGASVKEICLAPLQFSAWNKNDPNRALMLNVTKDNAAFRDALNIADLALRFKLPDITGGADHYHTIAIRPKWSDGEKPIKTVGTHKFYDITGAGGLFA